MAGFGRSPRKIIPPSISPDLGPLQKYMVSPKVIFNLLFMRGDIGERSELCPSHFGGSVFHRETRQRYLTSLLKGWQLKYTFFPLRICCVAGKATSTHIPGA
jgi:hypothetical protein